MTITWGVCRHPLRPLGFEPCRVCTLLSETSQTVVDDDHEANLRHHGPWRRRQRGMSGGWRGREAEANAWGHPGGRGSDQTLKQRAGIEQASRRLHVRDDFAGTLPSGYTTREVRETIARITEHRGGSAVAAVLWALCPMRLSGTGRRQEDGTREWERIMDKSDATDAECHEALNAARRAGFLLLPHQKQFLRRLTAEARA